MRIFILVALNLFFHCMQAASLDVFYTINRFYQIEEQKSYIEVSYLVPFNAVTYETNENKQLQAKLKVDFLLKNNEEVVYQKKYILQTPTYSSATEINQNLTDLVRLLAITDDTLTLAFSVTDMQDTTRTFYNQTAIFIPLVREASLSDIMLINSAESTNEKSAFERNDLLVIPKFLNYYPNDVTTLQFYCEFYQKTYLFQIN